VNKKVLDTLVGGIDDSITQETKRQLEQSIRRVSASLERTRENRSSNDIFNSKDHRALSSRAAADAELYTNLSDMINGANAKDVGGFSALLDNLYMKNRKYFTIIKDYEMMPILIPQINRVLMFLVNECLSPDIQNSTTFKIRYTAQSDPHRIQESIDKIKKEMKLDNLLREVYTNRYKLGPEYYLVIDYNATFDHMLDMMEQKQLNESTAAMTDIDYLESQYKILRGTIGEVGCSVEVPVIQESARAHTNVVNSTVALNFKNLNIQIDRSPLAQMVEDAHGELIAEAYSQYKTSNLINRMVSTGTLNEAVVDVSRMESLVSTMRHKKLQRCTIDRLDPAKTFRLKIGGRVIGFFYTTEIEGQASSLTVNFAQALKDQLVKARATNLNAATATAEEVISKELAERIINTFDPKLGIERVEDIDLLHDYIRTNEIYRGNKRITFYYADELFDMSRSDGSILTNGVFFTKLYATLLMNNIVTKVLRGRGRQIHTVQIGVSPNVSRYIQNAMASLTMPENNLGTLHGSFEQIMAPFNSSSDIIIPTDEESRKYIETDYIPGQDVDMNDEFLRTLLNAIVSSFGLDSAVLDATNGNLQFARTLTMESLQICNNIKSEQQDLHDSWEAMCLRVLEIMGDSDVREAIGRGQITVEFYEPKSLIIQNTIDDLNNAKTFAESIADIIPEFNEESAEYSRSKYVYQIVKDQTNIDWSRFEAILPEIKIAAVGDQLDAKIRELVREYMDNIQEERYGENNGATEDTVPEEGTEEAPGTTPDDQQAEGGEEASADTDDFGDFGGDEDFGI